MTNLLSLLKEKRGILLLFAGILLGLILLVFDNQGVATKQDTPSASTDTEEYATALEKKTEELINRISGVSNAKVMITLRDGGEQVFASDSTETNKKHVVVDNGLVCIKEYMPEIEGVAVVCEGGDNAVIKERITELLCSLLGIYSSHVYITE